MKIKTEKRGKEAKGLLKKFKKNKDKKSTTKQNETKTTETGKRFVAFDDAGQESIDAIRDKLGIHSDHVYLIKDKNTNQQREDELNPIAGPFEELVILGHTGNDAKKGKTTLGDYNAKAFAEKLALKVNPKDRGKIKHIFIIGCEVGLSKNGKESLAQEIANALYHEGFKGIEVHAITNPAEPTCYGMRVEVVSKVGAEGIVYQHVPGQLLAHFHRTQEQEDLCVELSNQPKFSNRATQITADTRYKSRSTLVDTADIREELLRPHNTFVPGGKGPLAKKNLQCEEFNVLVERTSRTHKDKKLRENLQELLPKLKAAKNKVEWENVIIEPLIKYYDSHKVVAALHLQKHDANASNFYLTIKSIYTGVDLSWDRLEDEVRHRAQKKTHSEQASDNRHDEKKTQQHNKRPEEAPVISKGSDKKQDEGVRNRRNNKRESVVVDNTVVVKNILAKLIGEGEEKGLYETRRTSDNCLKYLWFFKPKSDRKEQLEKLVGVGKNPNAGENEVREVINDVLGQLNLEKNKIQSSLQNILDECLGTLDNRNKNSL